ncbi:MAG: peptide chain release factor 2, partial [Kiritimatiellaeota bacterium]|nr:peptide chain release factor 2 [Kiritimatiellota bacterium]
MREIDEISQRLVMLTDGLQEMRRYLDIESRRLALAQLEEEAVKPGFWDDQNAAKETIAKTNAQRAFVRPFDALLRLLEDSGLMLELAAAEAEGDSRQQA